MRMFYMGPISDLICKMNSVYCCYPAYFCMLSVVYMLMGHMAYCINEFS